MCRRTSAAVLAGACAGILGLWGLQGVVFYILASAVVSVLLYLQTGAKWSDKFLSVWDPLWTGILGNILPYVLFWTLLYGFVHVYE